MRLTDRLAKAQKIAIVIALEWQSGWPEAISSISGAQSGPAGMPMHPLTQAVCLPLTRLAGWLRLIIWLALIGLWAAVPVRSLRPSPEEPSRH